MSRTRGPEPGARRQGDLDPNLPRATRSSEFKSAASFLGVSRTDPSSMFHPSLQSALHIQKPCCCHSQCETSADQRVCVCVDLPGFQKKIPFKNFLRGASRTRMQHIKGRRNLPKPRKHDENTALLTTLEVSKCILAMTNKPPP